MSNVDRFEISDEEWLYLYPKIRQIRGIYSVKADNLKMFLTGVLWILRSGAQWRILPEKYGKWNSVFKRFTRWCAKGIWFKTLELFALNADFAEVSIDSSVIRAHACSAGYAGSSAEKEALGRSKGGHSCKIHGISDASGLPIKFTLTGGQEADCQQAIPLLDGLGAKALVAVLADKGYDTNEIRTWLKERHLKAVIPPKSNRIEAIECDFLQYKERHVIECLFSKLKHYRRVAMRYEKKAINYMGMLTFSSVLLWVR